MPRLPQLAAFGGFYETLRRNRCFRGNSDDGAEILTIIMNDYFAEMLEILAKSDGQLLKFAGDALLVFFPSVVRVAEETSPITVNEISRTVTASLLA